MSDQGGQAPAGWYPDGQGGQRYWDGGAWLEPGQGPAQDTGGYPPPPAPAATPAYGTPTGGQGGTGGPGGPGQPKKSRGPLVALLGVVGLLVVAVVVALVLVLSGGSSDDPEEVVEAFLAAAEDQDCDAAEDLVTDDFIGGEDLCEGADTEDRLEPGSYEIGDAEVDGDQATVPVTITDEGTDVPFLFQLVDEGDGWRIDDVGFDTDALDLPDLGDLGDDSVAPDDGGSSDLGDLPTDLPTDLLSDFPSDFLSDFPTDFPTDFLSDFPTDLPTDLGDLEDFEDQLDDLLSEFPTDLFSDFPTDFPTG